MIRSAALALAPATRADCAAIARPCMRVGCRHHLVIDIDARGRIAIAGGSRLPDEPTFAELEAFVDELLARVREIGSCVLDLIEHHASGMTLEEVGERLVVSRERIRQMERKALLLLSPRIRRHLGKRIAAEGFIADGPTFPLES